MNECKQPTNDLKHLNIIIIILYINNYDSKQIYFSHICGKKPTAHTRHPQLSAVNATEIFTINRHKKSDYKTYRCTDGGLQIRFCVVFIHPGSNKFCARSFFSAPPLFFCKRTKLITATVHSPKKSVLITGLLMFSANKRRARYEIEIPQFVEGRMDSVIYDRHSVTDISLSLSACIRVSIANIIYMLVG